MKYTRSVDGQERADVRVTLRFTREEIEAFVAVAKEEGMTWRKWLERNAAEGIYREYLETQDMKGGS